MHSRLALTALSIAVLTACGGGGGGGTASAPPPTSGGGSSSGGSSGSSSSGGSSSGSSSGGTVNDPTPSCNDLPTKSYVLSEVDESNDVYSNVFGTGFSWMYNQLGSRPNYYRIETDTALVESGERAQFYAIDTNLCWSSDCTRAFGPYHRSESDSDTLNFRGERTFTAASFKVGNRYDLTTGSRFGTSIMQWTVATDYGPDAGGTVTFAGLMLQIEQTSGDLILYSRNSELIGTSIEDKGATATVIAPRGTFEDQWNYVVFDQTFDNPGDIKLYFNGECRFDGVRPNLPVGYEQANFKWGLYRRTSSEEEFNGEIRRQEILFDNIREGLTYEDIAY